MIRSITCAVPLSLLASKKVGVLFSFRFTCLQMFIFASIIFSMSHNQSLSAELHIAIVSSFLHALTQRRQSLISSDSIFMHPSAYILLTNHTYPWRHTITLPAIYK